MPTVKSTERTDGRAETPVGDRESLHGRHHLAFGVTSLQVSKGCRDLLERVAPIDAWTNLAAVDQLRQECEIVARDVRRHRRDVLPDTQRNAEESRHGGEPRDSGLASRGKSTPKIRNGSVPDGVEDEVITSSRVDEVGRRVIDDVIGAERADQI